MNEPTPIGGGETRAIDLADRLGLPQAGLFGSVSEVVLYVRTRFASAEVEVASLRMAVTDLNQILREYLDQKVELEAEVTSLREALAIISTERHNWCRWGHGPEHNLDKRRGDELCSCGKVQRDAIIDAVLFPLPKVPT